MRPVDPTCPVCGESVDDGGVLDYFDGEDEVCGHCESALKCEDGSMVLDYEEDHHRLSKDVVRLRQSLAEVRAEFAALRADCLRNARQSGKVLG